MTRSFVESQRHYFENSDPKRFRWQTTNRYVAQQEQKLLAPFLEQINGCRRLLEIGCGEGANLILAGFLSKTECWMLDQSWDRTRFAAQKTGGIGICGDGLILPFRSGSFDAVFIRDVLHHVEDPVATLREAQRVLSSEGRLFCIEPNGHNLFIRAFAALQPEERGALQLNPSRLRELLAAAGFDKVSTQMQHALPLWRVVCHYKYGWPGLTRVGAIRRLFDRVESWSQHAIRSEHWSYTIVCATKSPL